MADRVRVRFAPSPTGQLHIGNARTALFNWLFARHAGGDFILRIEDTDLARSTPESEKTILDDLRWLGLDWDEGPDVGGPVGPYRQSERGEFYRAEAERLLVEGRAYKCYCSDDELDARREEAQARGEAPHYDGRCRNLSEHERRAFEADGCAPVVRVRGPEHDVEIEDLVRGKVTFDRGMLGDFIILRSDGRPTYNFAVVVDDVRMKITHVIRAEDHLSNTLRQVLLYEELGSAPPAFAHVSMVVAEDGSKLSKRHGAASVADVRGGGFLPAAVVNYLSLLGWSHPDAQEIMPLNELAAAFELGRVSSHPAAFDEQKLMWINGHHIREDDLAVVAEAARPFIAAVGLDPEDSRFLEMLDLVRESAERLSDLASELGPLYDGALDIETEAGEWLARPETRPLLAAVAREVADAASPGPLDEPQFKTALKSAGKAVDVKGKELFMPVRAALTGRTHGPALGKIAAVLGRDRVLARLEARSAE
ncbi:glutamate--tRNA ligase [bacterium]|nr:glutamate--tRNA ligase [bacterium]